jgi:hypothetical protein
VGAGVGYVSHPHPVGLDHVELLLQVIGHNRRWSGITLTGAPTVAGLRTQTLVAHQPIGTVFAAAVAEIMQIVLNLAVAIDATALQPRLLDQSQKALVLLLSFGYGRTASDVIPAGMHRHHTAHAPY